MSWDIYGNRLLPGHCEVHPYVHETYPCSNCITEAKVKHQQNQEEKEHFAQMEREYYGQMERNHIQDMIEQGASIGGA